MAKRMIPRTFLVLVLASVLGCKGNSAKSGEPPADPEAGKPAELEGEAGKEGEASGDADKPANTADISWLSDDYAAALAAAKRADKPLVLDMWAPWCHTCISMEHTVFVDPGLKAVADRFVWLHVDTDKEVNAPVVAKYSVEAWPTFYVISPQDESVQARFVGGSSVNQFRAFLEQGEKGHLEVKATAGKIPADSPLAHMRAGDQAAVKGDHVAAASAYEKAIAAAPKDWPRLPEVLVAQIRALHEAESWDACNKLATDAATKVWVGFTASAADFAYYASQCAAKITDVPTQRLIRGRLIEAINKTLDAENSALSVDDRSGSLQILREIALALDDKDGAQLFAVRQRQLLDQATKDARSAYEAMGHAGPRSEVYVFLGEAESLIPELQKLVDELPKEYDPPYRLAQILTAVGKHDEALAAANKAATLAYGPRRCRVLELIADVHAAKGDKAAAKKALTTAIEAYESLPEGQKAPRTVERLKKQLAGG